MNEIIKMELKKLPIDLIQRLIADCEARIESHSSGSNVEESYISRQEEIISAARKEIYERNNK